MKRSHLPARTAVALTLVLLLGCGKRGDPQPPLRRAPLPVTGLSVSQRGGLIVISYQAPRTYSDGTRLPVLDVQLLRADREGDFATVAQVRPRSVAPGELIAETEPLPAPGTVLRFAARARVKGRLSPLASATALTVALPLSRPAGLVVQPASQGLRITWSAPPDAPAASYWVYRREQAGRFGRPLNAVPVAATSYDDQGAGAGERWCYVVRRVAATAPVVESAASEEACQEMRDVTAPAAPLGGALFAGSDALSLSWSPSPEADLHKYRVYVRRGDGSRELLAELPRTETSWRDPNRGRRGSYEVCAVDQAGNESAPSAPLEAQRP